MGTKGDETEEEEGVAIHKNYKKTYYPEVIKRISFSLICILPLTSYILYRDYLNYNQYSNYTNHMLILYRLETQLQYIHAFTYQTATTMNSTVVEGIGQDGSEYFRNEVFEILRDEKKQNLNGFSKKMNGYLSFYAQIMDETLCFQNLTEETIFTMAKCETELVLKRGLQTSIYRLVELSKNITTSVIEKGETIDMSGDRMTSLGSLIHNQTRRCSALTA